MLRESALDGLSEIKTVAGDVQTPGTLRARYNSYSTPAQNDPAFHLRRSFCTLIATHRGDKMLHLFSLKARVEKDVGLRVALNRPCALRE
jgi:hypothetical protein